MDITRRRQSQGQRSRSKVNAKNVLHEYRLRCAVSSDSSSSSSSSSRLASWRRLRRGAAEVTSSDAVQRVQYVRRSAIGFTQIFNRAQFI